MVPMSMYQAVQGVQTIQTPAGTALHTLPGLNITPGLPQNIQLAMAPVLNNPIDSIVAGQSGETNVTEQQSGEVTSQQETTDTTTMDTTATDTTSDQLQMECVNVPDNTQLVSVPDNTQLVIDATEPKHQSSLEGLVS